MSRLNRFFFAGAHCPGDLLQLDAERSNYLCRVLRLRDADPVDIFDGEGGLYRCQISKAHQRRAEIQVVEQIAAFDKPEQAPSLGMALLKGQAMDRAIAQATELGAQHIWLLQADRSNLPIRTERLEQKLSHWRRIIASACEQCGQPWLPMLHPPMSVQACLAEQTRAMTVVFDPDGDPLPSRAEMTQPLVLIGPEGGWSDEEVALFAEQGTARYRLGSTILRAETMPAVALALIQQMRGWPG